MEKKQKVLIVHNYYQIPGGEDTVVANEKKLLEDHGHQVVLYTRSNTEMNGMGKIKKLLLPFITVYNPRTAKDVKRIVKEHGIDIVHVHNTLFFVSPAVYYAARKMAVPVIQTIHNFRLLCPGATLYRDGKICEDCLTGGLGCAVRHACYRGSKAQTLMCVIAAKLHRMTGIYSKIYYIALTEFNKKKLLNLSQIKGENIFVKPNFMDAKGEACERNGFLFAGRIDKLKGIDVLIEAWKLMGEKAPCLTICGTGPMEEWCRSQIEKNRLNIEMTGYVKNTQVQEMLMRSKALLLPTMWYEGFPMSIVEAYAVGTPVICSDLGNAGAVVEEGITGWKFDPGSAEGLVKAIHKWTDISADVKRVYQEKYTAEANYERLKEIYQYVSSNHARRISVNPSMEG